MVTTLKRNNNSLNITYLDFITRWCKKNDITRVANSFPGQSLGPPPNAIKGAWFILLGWKLQVKVSRQVNSINFIYQFINNVHSSHLPSMRIEGKRVCVILGIHTVESIIYHASPAFGNCISCRWLLSEWIC